jgi:hypothetical protein
MSTIQISKSKYKGVDFVLQAGKYKKWRCCGIVNGKKFNFSCETEKEAAILYDKKMIESGRQPVNLLIKKETNGQKET